MFDAFEDLLGEAPRGGSALDTRLVVTIFPDSKAQRKTEHQLTLRQVAEHIQLTRASVKDGLPWLKLARFGDWRTERNCLRSNDNMLTVSGLEADYDGGLVTLGEASERLRRHGLAGLVYTTPSHTPEHPRWRVLVPLSTELPADRRDALAEWLNGVFDGDLDQAATFTRSQCMIFGAVDGGAPVDLELIEGKPLDRVPALQSIARPKGAVRRDAPPMGDDEDEEDDDWLLRQVACDWDRIKEALGQIPPHNGRENGAAYDEWCKVGMALHHVSDGSDEGLAEFLSWSSGWPDCREREVRQKWRSFGKSRSANPVTIATLYEIAKGYGWGEKAAAPSSHLTFLTPAQCEASPSRGYVIKGLLAPGDVGCIFGAPGAGKSLLAPHLGFAVAQGAAAFGMRTKAGGVFYVAAEDPSGMRGRVSALRAARGEADSFVLVEGVSDLLSRESADLRELRKVVKARRPALIAIDTLAMAFPGLEENSAADMGRVVAVARKLADHGAAVVLIHHDTKAEGMTPRGHSLLNGALDVALHVKRDESGIVRATLTKNRNGSCEQDVAFTIDTRSLGVDEDGDAVTAALVKELPPGAAPKREKMTPKRAAFQILQRMADGGGLAEGDGWVSESAWRDACLASRAVSAAESEDSRKRVFRRIVTELAAEGRVEFANGMVREAQADLGASSDEPD